MSLIASWFMDLREMSSTNPLKLQDWPNLLIHLTVDYHTLRQIGYIFNLGYLQRALSAKGYSMQAMKAITLAHRPSTRDLKDDKLHSFKSFRKEKHQNPGPAEYLLFLRHKRHLKGCTLMSNLVALNSILGVPEDWKITKVLELQALIRRPI